MNGGTVPYGADLPDGWSSSPLKYLASLTNGYVFNSQDWKDNGTPIIRIENLNGSRDFNYSDSELEALYRITKGDLLFSWSGNPGTSFGPFRWNFSGDFYLNQHIFKVAVFGCDKNWLFWALKAATHWIERELTSGMIGMVHVTKEDLKDVPIPIPPLEEQRRIAEFLDAETSRIDRLIDLQRALIDRMNEREVAHLDLAIDRAISDAGAAPLRRFVRDVDQGTSPQCEAFPAPEGEWGVLKVGCLRPGIFFPEENKRLPDGVEPKLSAEVREGDLLIARANTPQLVGSTAVVPRVRRKLLLPDKIFRVSLSSDANADFIASVARGSRIRGLCSVSSNGASQSMANIRFEEVKNWPIPAIKITEQREFIARIAQGRQELDALRPAVKRQLDLLAERRQALITAAVTGQFDVNTASRSTPSGGIA